MQLREIFSHTHWRSSLPRVLADLILVHLAAITALVCVVSLQWNSEDGTRIEELIHGMKRYYTGSFLPLSILFPAVFYVSGFYTTSRTYVLRHKVIALGKGATLATLIYLFANFLMSRADDLPRTASVALVVLVNVMTLGARLLKMWMSPAPAPRSAAIVQSVRSEDETPVLVVGGGGYIGSILCRKLLAQNRRVRLLDSFVYGNAAVKDLFGHPRFELHVGDCRNIQSVVSAVSGINSIIHLAAVVGDPACEQDRQAALEINYAATRMLVEISKGHHVRRLVFASSCSVYGETEAICDELSQPNPISLYARTKVDSETALLRARTATFHPTILRLATVFGASYRPRFDLVVNLLVAKALREGVITIYNGEQWRPFIHVSDVADGFIKALDASESIVSGAVYNLGDSRLNYTLTQVAQVIQSTIPQTRVEHVTNPDRRNYRVAFDKIERELGFLCKISLEEGVEDLRRALMSHLGVDYTDPLYNNQKYLKGSDRLVSQEEIDAQVMAAFAIAISNNQRGLTEVHERIRTER